MTYAMYADGTCADALYPSTKRRALLYDSVLILGGSLFLALCAQVAIPLPFSPVPVTGQTLGVLLIGMVLGSRRGTLCLLTYLAEGALGLPVFAAGPTIGLARLLGPTGGYLVGFIAAAYVTGRLAELGWDRKPGLTLLAMIAGNLAIYVPGLIWLAGATSLGVSEVLTAGFVPFIAGDAVKLAIATALVPSGWALIGEAQGA